MAAPPVTGDDIASVFLTTGLPNTLHGVFLFGQEAIRLWVEFSGGTFQQGSVSGANIDSSMRDNEYDGDVVPMIGLRGETNYLALPNPRLSSQTVHAASLGVDSFSATFTVGALDVPGELFDYDLSGTLIGRTILGNYTATRSGQTVHSDTFIGYVGDGSMPAHHALPALAPVVPAADSSESGFQPPYFGELTPAQIRDRVLAGALWLTTSPVVSVFGDDISASETGSEGNKHYDNAAWPAYGGAVAWGILSELANDPELVAFARDAARRAGIWIDNRGDNYQGLATYYKQMFFVSVWAPLAHMDLYETTGEQRWLDAVKGYMDFLQNEVRNRMAYPEVHDPLPDDGVGPGRTWVMLNEETGEPGESNKRYDRSYDHTELHPAEFLWLLGKLRVDHGITDYAVFEADAYQWILDNLNDAYIWHYRPGNPAEESPQAVGPTFFADYLLDYAPTFDQAVLDQVIAHVESVHVTWEHPLDPYGFTDRFSPAVRDEYPRWTSGYLGKFVPGTAATSRMALVYLKRYREFGNPDDLGKARAMALSVLNRQKESSGMIDNIGHKLFSDDHKIRLVSGPNGTPPDAFGNPLGRMDQHPYSGLKANALRNLLEFADLLESVGEGCSQSQSIDAPSIIQKAPTDPPFTLSATATSGLPVVFEHLSGPASLSGDTLTLDGTTGIVRLRVHQPGDNTWCEAASRLMFVSVGDNTPAMPDNLTANGIDSSTVALTWTDNAGNEDYYKVQYREEGTSSWSEQLFPPDSVGGNIAFLDASLSYEFRVLAGNDVAESNPTPIQVAAPQETPVYVFLEIGCNGLVANMEAWSNPDAYGGEEIFIPNDQRNREDILPESIMDLFFEVPVTASYHLWLRGYTTEGGSSDSIWLKVDDGIHIGTGSDTFYTTPIYNAGYGSYGWAKNNDTFPLTEGTTHKISIAGREDGAVIDRIMLTTDSSLLTHFGKGDAPVNCGDSGNSTSLSLFIVKVEGSLELQFPTEAGTSYRVEVSSSLLADEWEDLSGLVIGDGNLHRIPIGVLPGNRDFFRLRQISP